MSYCQDHPSPRVPSCIKGLGGRRTCSKHDDTITRFEVGRDPAPCLQGCIVIQITDLGV
jgi:hypothetical protein